MSDNPLGHPEGGSLGNGEPNSGGGSSSGSDRDVSQINGAPIQLSGTAKIVLAIGGLILLTLLGYNVVGIAWTVFWLYIGFIITLFSKGQYIFGIVVALPLLLVFNWIRQRLF